jgi:hypothetical protein
MFLYNLTLSRPSGIQVRHRHMRLPDSTSSCWYAQISHAHTVRCCCCCCRCCSVPSTATSARPRPRRLWCPAAACWS